MGTGGTLGQTTPSREGFMISKTTCAMLAAVMCAAATPAGAACQRLAFLVNDYGKDGPTKDAKKDVKCELFLNFIVFDEHTCEASALVCWGGGPGAPATPAANTPAPATPAAKPPSAK